MTVSAGELLSDACAHSLAGQPVQSDCSSRGCTSLQVLESFLPLLSLLPLPYNPYFLHTISPLSCTVSLSFTSFLQLFLTLLTPSHHLTFSFILNLSLPHFLPSPISHCPPHLSLCLSLALAPLTACGRWCSWKCVCVLLPLPPLPPLFLVPPPLPPESSQEAQLFLRMCLRVHVHVPINNVELSAISHSPPHLSPSSPLPLLTSPPPHLSPSSPLPLSHLSPSSPLPLLTSPPPHLSPCLTSPPPHLSPSSPLPLLTSPPPHLSPCLTFPSLLA